MNPDAWADPLNIAAIMSDPKQKWAVAGWLRCMAEWIQRMPDYAEYSYRVEFYAEERFPKWLRQGIEAALHCRDCKRLRPQGCLCHIPIKKGI